MAIVEEPGSTTPKAGERFPVTAMVLVAVVFGFALFSVDNLILEAARAGWQQIQLIQGSFNPETDAQKLYQAANNAKAMDSAGTDLPQIAADGKIPQYDGRIIEQAARERRIQLPDIFKPAPSG